MELHAPEEANSVDEHGPETEQAAFVRQVADRALPAPQVLQEQRGELGPDGPTQVFIP